MLKKSLVFSLLLVFVLAGAALTFAAQNVANTSQKGSLLVFPQIWVDPFDDTIIQISNDYHIGTWVKCYWMTADQQVEDFMFFLTGNQPVWFRASDGQGTHGAASPITVPPFPVHDDIYSGELKCWAVKPDGAQQISFNHLYGSATIVSFARSPQGQPILPVTLQYNSFNFAARNVSLNNPVGDPGVINLTGLDNGKGYDACPKYVLFNFFCDNATLSINVPVSMKAVFGQLALAPCKQDLRQDRNPTCTKAKFDLWNENETKYTGAYQCIKCYFDGYLDQLQFGGEKFTFQTLHTEAGRFRVQGVKSSVCDTTEWAGGGPSDKPCSPIPNPNETKTSQQTASPMIGVLITQWRIPPSTSPTNALSITTGNTAGADGTGFILWDPGEVPLESPGR